MEKVRRDTVRPGDLVESSHGYRLFITRVRVSALPEGSTYLWGNLHGPGGSERSELYPSDIPIALVERGEGNFVSHPFKGPVGGGVDYQLVSAEMVRGERTADRFHNDVRSIAQKLRNLADKVERLDAPGMAMRQADLEDAHPDYPKIASLVVNEISSGVKHLFLDSLVMAAVKADREIRSKPDEVHS